MAFDFLANLFGQNRLAQPQQQGNALVQPVQQQQPGMMDRYRAFTDSDRGQMLNEMFTGWAMGATPQQSLGMGAQMLAQGRQKRKGEANQNQTVEWLKGQGMDEGQAKFVASQPTVLSDYLKQKMQQGTPEYQLEQDYRRAQIDNMRSQIDERKNPDRGQGFINAGSGNLFNTQTGEWVSAPGGGVDSVAGLETVWLRDPKTGKPVPGQLRKDGTIVRSALPDGLEAIGPYDVSFDKSSGAAAGKGVGEAKTQLPGARMMAGEIDQYVNGLKNDPYLPNTLGPINSRLPNVTADAARVQGKIDQLRGGAFLAARQALKGGGAITDYEGQKAEQALARMQTAQSVEDFNKALDEFNAHVQRGLQMLEGQAGQTGVDKSGGGQGGPAAGAVEDGYRFKGGNPSDPNSWEQVR